MSGEVTVEISAHASERMDQYGVRDVARFRRLVREADGDIFDRKHGSKLVVLTEAGHAVAVADEAGIRTVITLVPPPETSWAERIRAQPDRYERLDS